jgi:hypothetical protein
MTMNDSNSNSNSNNRSIDTGKHYSPKYKRFYNDKYYYKDHEYDGPSRRNAYRDKSSSLDPLRALDKRIKYINRLQKTLEKKKYDKSYRICESGFTQGQGWGGLYRSWLAFLINVKKTGDLEMIERYALAIQKIERDMGLVINQFPELKLAALEYMEEEGNYDVLEERANKLHKPVEELSSQDILDVMIERDQKAYELIRASKQHN